MIAFIFCVVVAVSDADSITCHSGEKVRLAGVSALERNGSCNSVPDCPVMRHRDAQPIAARMMLGRTIRFRVVGKSWGRAVGENYGIRCALVASGAVVPWPRYMAQYGLRRCGGV